MENHQEDILKKFLQDTFSDYEPEPKDASWSTIFSAIQPNQPTFWDKSKPWIASGLVVFICGVVSILLIIINVPFVAQSKYFKELTTNNK